MKKIVIKILLVILLLSIVIALGIFIGTTGDRQANAAEQSSSSGEILKTYAVTDKELKPNIILKDNIFDTQIQDLNINFNKYEGKTIQIEGFYFTNTVTLRENTPEEKTHTYIFVGRYSVSNLCPTCPAGYSYFEFEWHGNEPLNIKEEDDWIRVTGILKKGIDEEDIEYYYLDAQRIDIMKERGQETVTN